MDLVELNPLRNFLVGVAGVDGLSTEQRNILTMVVELVAKLPLYAYLSSSVKNTCG